YIDPAYRDRAPRLVTNASGRQQLQVDSALLGSAERGLGAIGAIGARDGHVIADGFEYDQGRPGGFDPHKRIPDMDMDGIDAAFLYPSLGLFTGAVEDPPLAAAMCRAYN